MKAFFKNQKTIGLLGQGPDLDHFVNKANDLGYITYQLCKEKEAKISSNADKLFFGLLSDPEIQENFVKEIDLLLYFDPAVDLTALEKIKESVYLPQGEDLLAISQDRSLEKAFYESVGVNLAPYELIVKEEDIKAAMPSIGYPAVLRRNAIKKEDRLDSYFIYEEADIQEASKLLKYGPAILESWIVADHYLAVTAIKEENGNIQLYPIVEKTYKNDRLDKISIFEEGSIELMEEVKKASRLIVESIDFVGLLSLNFIVSPAEALYLGDLHPYPNDLSRYTEASLKYSSLQLYLRAINSLPLAQIDSEAVDNVYQAVYADQIQSMRQLILDYPKDQIYFDPRIKSEGFDENTAIAYRIRDKKI